MSFSWLKTQWLFKKFNVKLSSTMINKDLYDILTAYLSELFSHLSSFTQFATIILSF